MPKGGFTIWLRGGDYLRTKPLELTAADSGTPKGPDDLAGLQGRDGSPARRAVTDRLTAVTDPALLARLPEVARGYVVQLDLKALGITDFGQMQSRGFARPLAPAHCELFYGGRPMTLARWPNEGESERIAGFPEGEAIPR